MKDEKKYTIGSLFSGIRGIELGFERAGFKTVWYIEREPFCQAILRKHSPSAIIYGNIKEVDFTTVPKVDILTGGFPCQDISDAGNRVGIKGSRSSLWKDYKEAIRILRPRIAFIENVSALAHRGLDVVLADFASIGYDAEWHCVPASSVGAWHRRRRIFIIAYPNLHGQYTLREDGRKFQSNQEQNIQAVSSEGIQSPIESIQDGKLEYVSNTNSERLQGWKETRDIKDEGKNRQQFTPGQGWWATEPKLGRVAHGIPNRIHRIKSLGNAVVPQVAEVFAIAIKERLNYYDGGDFNPLTEESLIRLKRESADSLNSIPSESNSRGKPDGFQPEPLRVV